jgi:MYXO-CTERM domain-containing protein
MIHSLRVAGLACAVAFTLLPGRAHAFVRYKTESTMVGFYWPQSWVPVTAYPLSIKDARGEMEMTSDQILAAATAAGDSWSKAQNDCTYLQINLGSSTAAAPAAKYDARNSLVFRTTTWCPSDPAAACYDPAALAITSVFVNKKDGKIRDADIEVNAKNFVWADLDVEPSAQGKQDLQNALAHEMGHLIGLDHTCVPAGTPPPIPVDNDGNEVPDCETAPQAVRETTMFASAIPGDKEKRTLAPDDIAAVCAIYPVANDPMIYITGNEDTSACACALDGDGRGAGAVVPILGMLAALVLRRRARGG